MNKYAELEAKIEIKFGDPALFDVAFTHKSYINEHRDENLKDNERLEFLGDAVLELAATNHLFYNYPDKPEGEMTAYRSALVKGKHLAKVAKNLDLGKYLFLSHGEEKSGGREKNYILANTVEALIGAIYIEQGYDTAEKFIKKFIIAEIDTIIEQGLHIDPKSQLQEMAQDKEDFTPYYELVANDGPDHDKQFTMGVYINDKIIAEGTGSSKQKAENSAAENALKALKWD